MSRQSPKRQLFAQFAELAKALGHGDRVELLEHLAQGERSVEALSRLIDVPIANASQHLQRLRRAGLIRSRRDGKFVLYRLADDSMVTLLGSLRVAAERNLAEVDRIVQSYYRERDTLEPVSREELLERLRLGLVTVLDVRPADEYALGHIAGAISIPSNQLAARLGELDPARAVIAYCRGPYCVFALDAVAILRRHGFEARRLSDGLPEWKVAGLPVLSGPTAVPLI